MTVNHKKHRLDKTKVFSVVPKSSVSLIDLSSHFSSNLVLIGDFNCSCSYSPDTVVSLEFERLFENTINNFFANKVSNQLLLRTIVFMIPEMQWDNVNLKRLMVVLENISARYRRHVSYSTFVHYLLSHIDTFQIGSILSAYRNYNRSKIGKFLKYTLGNSKFPTDLDVSSYIVSLKPLRHQITLLAIVNELIFSLFSGTPSRILVDFPSLLDADLAAADDFFLEVNCVFGSIDSNCYLALDSSYESLKALSSSLGFFDSNESSIETTLSDLDRISA